MPIRMLRDWTDSEKMNTLSVHAERFFVRLIMIVDDFGCYYANTSLLKAKCFPLLLDEVREADITRWMDECYQAGLIVLYESSNKKYLQIVEFNQRMDKARAKYPLPDGQEISLHGYVYFMGAEDDNVFKIGYSLNPWARLKEVTRSKDAIELLKERSKIIQLRYSFKGTTENERVIHKLLREKNIKNEWFRLDNATILLLSKLYNDNKHAHSIINVLSSNTVDNYVPAETEYETEKKPNTNRAKALVIAGDDSQRKLRSAYDEIVKSLEGKERLDIWNTIREFISINKPAFLDPYMDLWNVFAVSQHLIKEQQRITDQRRKKFATRIQEPAFDFIKILEKIKASPFLRGNNQNNWKVTIEFILSSEENYTKILEGKYD